jgi:hypothetical protein
MTDKHEIISAAALAKLIYEIDDSASAASAKRTAVALLEHFRIYWREGEVAEDPARFASRASHCSS